MTIAKNVSFWKQIRIAYDKNSYHDDERSNLAGTNSQDLKMSFWNFAVRFN